MAQHPQLRSLPTAGQEEVVCRHGQCAAEQGGQGSELRTARRGHQRKGGSGEDIVKCDVVELSYG